MARYTTETYKDIIPETLIHTKQSVLRWTRQGNQGTGAAEKTTHLDSTVSNPQGCLSEIALCARHGEGGKSPSPLFAPPGLIMELDELVSP